MASLHIILVIFTAVGFTKLSSVV